MIELSLKLNPSDTLRFFRALIKIANTVHISRKQYPYRMALIYADLLRKNISQGTFAATYPGYTFRYEQYKKLMVGHTKPWILFGDVLANISVFPYGKGFMGGIPAGRFDRGQKGWFGTGAPSAIAAYARANEFGEGRTKERPVFRPTFDQFKKKEVPHFIKKFRRDVVRWWR